MSGTPGTSGNASPDTLRPLPARPNLEFERKRAKKLRRELRRADPEAKLADAQFQIAREYGFLSWPKLVMYFQSVARHDVSVWHDSGYAEDHHESWAKTILAEHRQKRAWTAHVLGASVPRFFGKSAREVLASDITLDEARLATARGEMCPSWAVLLERCRRARELQPDGWKGIDSPLRTAVRGLKDGDFATVERAIAEHPELLLPPTRDDPARPGSLVAAALSREWREASDAARKATDWLVAHGASLRDELGRQLTHPVHHELSRDADGKRKPNRRLAEYITFLLDRGADPNWLPPNGISVLEHALVRYCIHNDDPDAIELIAQRVTPRKAFWIAAGLGDVRAVARYVRRDGSLTDDARRVRPDFTAMLAHGWPTLPDPPDNDIILEAFFVAAMNRRWTVMDLLLERGFPIDYSPWGSTMASHFIGRSLHERRGGTEYVEYFVSRGADLDIRGWRPAATPREIAQEYFAEHPTDPTAQRVLELCGGGEPDEVLRAYQAQVPPPREPTISPDLEQTLRLAREEAARFGQPTVEPHNLFVAMLRGDRSLPLTMISSGGGADLLRLRTLLKDRLVGAEAEPGVELPLSPESQAVLDGAMAAAQSKRFPHVTSMHMLQQLAAADTGPVADIIAAAGGTVRRLRGTLAEAI